MHNTLPPALRDLPVALGVKSTVDIEIRAVNVQIRQLGHALQGVQPPWQKHGIRLIHRRHRTRSQHEAVIVHDRDDLSSI